ncbi:hypothetical protein TNIN_335251, partial [Trichonephila inaurata madagascariensis]
MVIGLPLQEEEGNSGRNPAHRFQTSFTRKEPSHFSVSFPNNPKQINHCSYPRERR